MEYGAGAGVKGRGRRRKESVNRSCTVVGGVFSAEQFLSSCMCLETNNL